MPTAFIDRTSTLSCTEKNGIITSLVRECRVIGLVSTDYQVLWAGLQAANIPTVPSGIAGVGYESLVLVGRQAKIVDQDKGTVDVTLEYDSVVGNQELNRPQGLGGNGFIYGKMKASIQQKPTNFYYDNLGVKQQIFVQHTFPPGDCPPGYVPGQQITQAGEIQGTFVGQNFQFGGFINTVSPGLIKEAMLNKVNADNFLDSKKPFTWLCAEVSYELVGLYRVNNASIPRYKFNFEFQYNANGWYNEAVFIDPRTGKPPKSLVDGVGYKTVPYIPAINFEGQLSVILGGGAIIRLQSAL